MLRAVSEVTRTGSPPAKGRTNTLRRRSYGATQEMYLPSSEIWWPVWSGLRKKSRSGTWRAACDQAMDGARKAVTRKAVRILMGERVGSKAIGYFGTDW